MPKFAGLRKKYALSEVTRTFQHKLKNEVSGFFRFNKPTRLWDSPVMASLALGIPLLTGVFTNQMQLAGMACFGGLVILHYTPVQAFKKRILVLVCCSAGMIASFCLGALMSFTPFLACIFLGVFSVLVHIIVKLIRLRAPGNFFFIAVATIGCSLPHNIHSIPMLSVAMALGTGVACLLAFCYGLLFQPGIVSPATPVILPAKPKLHAILTEAVITGAFIFISMLAGYLLGVTKPYWIPLSCLSVMQGITRQHVWQRVVHRIIGTFAGVGLCWIILKINTSPLMICFMIMLLQFITETFISRHYALAIIFVTPMTILMAEAGNPSLQHPDTLAYIRLLDITIGSLIGAFGGWMLYNEKLKQAAGRSIRKTKVLFLRGKEL